MSMASHRIDDDDANERRNRLEELGVPWVQFGDDVVLLASDDQAPALRTRARSAGIAPAALIDSRSREHLYLVTQIGRLFQRQHPEVNVLFDRGRYLVVELDADLVEEIGKQRESDYKVRPLEENSVVFDLKRSSAARTARIDSIQALVDRIERSSVESNLNHLVSYPTRYSTSSHYADAAAWARGQLQSFGYATQLEPFPLEGGTTQNVIAHRDGSGSSPRNLVLVTAHLDSINLDDRPAGPAPGADDNGSGSAGVLEIARVLQDHVGVHDLQLILFGGEEEGLFGSLHHVAQLAPADRERLRAVVNMDMIGTLNAPTPAVLLEGGDVSRSLIDGLAAAAATYTGLTIQVSLDPFGSDHIPFIDNGLAAVLTIEGTDQANEHEHTANDTLDHINYDLMLEILRMNTAFIASELDRQE
jgi:hypothetical protein